MNVYEFQLKLLEIKEAKNLSVESMAHTLRLPVPTVERWINGENFPHKFMREGVIKSLEVSCVTE